MTNISPTPPAGWYADPSGSPAQRWWDGAKWTEHLQAVPVPQPVAQPRYGELAPNHIAPIDPTQRGNFPQQTYGNQGQYGDQTYGGNPNRNQRAVHNNRSAWISLIFGVLAAAIAVSDSLPTSTSVFASTIGIFAVVNGIVAINHRRAGISNNLWAPVIGIVLGAIATLVMFAIFFASR
jgi:Protein of unknown function (DUF2510)